MKNETLKSLRYNLLGRQRAALERREHSLAGERELLEERELDWRDTASHVTGAALLEGIGEVERRELGRIDAALGRIDNGTYGTCVACRGPIGLGRLHALPEADRCAECAGVPERG